MPGRKPTKSDLKAYEEQLRLMLGVLRGDISHLEAESISQAGADRQGDDGDSYSLELSLELLQRGGSTASDILEALGRIGDGSYGRCDSCDGWIRKERLQAIPYVSFCIDCQRQAEAG